LDRKFVKDISGIIGVEMVNQTRYLRRLIHTHKLLARLRIQIPNNFCLERDGKQVENVFGFIGRELIEQGSDICCLDGMQRVADKDLVTLIERLLKTVPEFLGQFKFNQWFLHG